MAVKLLNTLFDFPVGTIVRDLSYDIERRLVALNAATYDTSGGTEASTATFSKDISAFEHKLVSLEELVLTNRNKASLEPFAASDWVLHGIYDYQDLATQSTPVSLTLAGGWTDVPNDAAGPNTRLVEVLPEVPTVYDPIADEFDWTDLEIGDKVELRIDLKVTTTAPNQVVEVRLLNSVGEAGEFATKIGERLYKTVGSKDINIYTSLYMGPVVQPYPSKVQIKTDADASMIVSGWFITACPRFPKQAL